ncbi:MerR family transcriptional regulator [Thermophilibacter sp.]
MGRRYKIGELAELSGVSVRALRFYEEAGLIAPGRDPTNGYRLYAAEDVDRLQEILLLRHLGVAVRDIAPLLSTTSDDRVAALVRHLDELIAERDQLNTLIATVERTLAEMRGELDMADSEKFEGFKYRLVEDNERRYGVEARGRYGDEAIDATNREVLGMSERECATWQELDARILEALASAVRTSADPAGPEGARVCELHRQWLGYTWPSYSVEAHRGLAESYVADERFTAYYDRDVPGCAAWLRDAIVAHA